MTAPLAVFRALADPTRLRILAPVRRMERPLGGLNTGTAWRRSWGGMHEWGVEGYEGAQEPSWALTPWVPMGMEWL